MDDLSLELWRGLSEFLLTEGGSLVQSGLVLGDLRRQVLDLRVQASARGGGLLNRGLFYEKRLRWPT